MSTIPGWRTPVSIGAPLRVQPRLHKEGQIIQTTIIRVSDWPTDEDFPVFPGGSQPKTGLRCPEDLGELHVIPRHRYIFKNPRGWRVAQVWSEIVASEIGGMVGVKVPRTLLAYDEAGRIGALMEFFYNYPGSIYDERLLHGADILTRVIRDKKRGRPHGATTNVRIAEKYGVANASALWGGILAFDALIGNTDRHPSNWGLVRQYLHGSLPSVSLAPAFDNGNSLGFDWSQAKLLAGWNDDQLGAYALKGVHHCGWSQADDKRGGHFDLCRRFVGAYPNARDAMMEVTRIDMRAVDGLVDHLVGLGGPSPLTPERARFICDLVRVRRNLLAAALEA